MAAEGAQADADKRFEEATGGEHRLLLAMALGAGQPQQQTNGSPEPVINELDVPAILRRRMM